jgi:hypothetical protein
VKPGEEGKGQKQLLLPTTSTLIMYVRRRESKAKKATATTQPSELGKERR